MEMDIVEDLVEKARKTVGKILYLTLATCNDKGEPWNSPVYVGFDENYNFYWLSWSKNVHSKNIDSNGRVFAVLYDSTVPASVGKGFGVYMRGTAHSLGKRNLKEMLKALKLIYRRIDKKSRGPKEFLGLFPRRIYKFTPEQVWVNATDRVKSSPVDTRIDITKQFLE